MISIDCFMFGDDGCQTKCSLQCTLYDCTPRTSCCDEDFHCNCDEVYDFGSNQLSQTDFEFLEFNDLWKMTFEDSIFSRDLRKTIRGNPKAEKYILELLRNPHVSGDDIKAIIEDKYPHWGDAWHLRSTQHTRKTKLSGAGKSLKIKDIKDHYDELSQLMKTKPTGDIRISKVQHRRRIRQFLEKITNIGDLEELLHLIKLSGDQKLYQLAKSILKRLGYGFEEDGEKPGEKGILRTLDGELEDANEHEIMEVAILNEMMSKISTTDEDTKDFAVADKLNKSKEITSTKMATNQQAIIGLQYKQNDVSAPPPSAVSNNNVAGSSYYGQIVPLMPSTSNSENDSYFTQVSATGNANLMPSFISNINTLPLDGSSLSANAQAITSVGTNGQAVSSSTAQKTDLGHKLYYIVVDETGKISQANMVPKIPFMPGSMPAGPPSTLRNSSSQETSLSNNSQANVSWYGLPPFQFGPILPFMSNSRFTNPQGPPSSFPTNFLFATPPPLSQIPNPSIKPQPNCPK